MEIKKKYEEMQKKNQQVAILEEELSNTVKRAQELAKKEKEVTIL